MLSVSQASMLIVLFQLPSKSPLGWWFSLRTTNNLVHWWRWQGKWCIYAMNIEERWMGRKCNRSRQCFSACSFRRPLTTSSASILNPSWNISPKHSFKTQNITSCLDDQRKKSLPSALWTRPIVWSSVPHRFVGWRIVSHLQSLAAIKLTHLSANANKPESVYALPHHPNYLNPQLYKTSYGSIFIHSLTL